MQFSFEQLLTKKKVAEIYFFIRFRLPFLKTRKAYLTTNLWTTVPFPSTVMRKV